MDDVKPQLSQLRYDVTTERLRHPSRPSPSGLWRAIETGISRALRGRVSTRFVGNTWVILLKFGDAHLLAQECDLAFDL